MRFVRAVAFAILKFAFCVLGWVLWALLFLPLAVIDGFIHGSGYEGRRSRKRVRQHGSDDVSLQALDETQRDWAKGFIHIWQFFYGGGDRPEERA